MHPRIVIIGGGVAGLCAAIRLTELGIEPVVIESGSYPSHKVCGEFISPATTKNLLQWGISPHKISQAYLTTPTKRLVYNFNVPAGALSHTELDPYLMRIAKDQGAAIHTEVKVLHIAPQGAGQKEHLITLSSGAIIAADALIIATGRIPSLNQAPPKMLYKGFKAHFKDIPIKNSLEMFCFKGAYLGIAPISNDCCNIACLASIETFNKYNSIEEFVDALRRQNSLFNAYLGAGTNLFPEWMSTSVPSFGCKALIEWPHTYAIGDAAGTIPPATGNGISMAISSGLMAAEFASRTDPKGFQQAWKTRFTAPISWGKALHQLMLHPRIASSIMHVASLFPSLQDTLFECTRHR